MPAELRDRIAADVRAVAPEMPAERLAGMGQVIKVGSTADFITMIDDQRKLVAAIVRAGGAKPK
jgi:hypothetical protein